MAGKSLVGKSIGEWLDSTGHMYMEVDPALAVTFANSALKIRFGLPGNKECYQYLCRAEEMCHQCPIREVLHGSHCAQTELTSLDRQGQRVFLHATGVPIKDQTGNIIGAGVLIMDVSRTHRMEEMVKASNLRYQQLVDQLPDVVFSLNYMGEFTFVNSQADELLAYQSQQIIGKPLWDLIDSEDAKSAETLLQATPGTVWDKELSVRDAKGVGKHVRIRINPRFDNQGNLLGFDGVMRDRTAQWELEHQIQACRASLTATKDKYWSLVEEIPDIVFDLDSSGHFTSVNSRVEEFLGYSVEHMLGTSMQEYVDQEHLSVVEAILALQPREVCDEEIAIVDSQGDTKWVRIRCRASLDSSGNVLGFEGVMAERTPGKMVEEEIDAARRALLDKTELLDALRTREEHAAQLAQELEQPLGVIKGFVSRMAGKLGACQERDPGTQTECYQVIMKEVKQLEDILCHLNDLTSRKAIRLQQVDPNILIREVLRNNEKGLKEKNLTFHAELDDDQRTVPLDPHRFQQVLQNVMTNAMEVSSENDTIRLVTGVFVQGDGGRNIQQQRGESYFEVKIRNSGTPLPSEVLGKIFDPVYTTKDQGLGIGLALSGKIVEEHHGTISVQSEDSETVFTVRIPMNPNKAH